MPTDMQVLLDRLMGAIRSSAISTDVTMSELIAALEIIKVKLINRLDDVVEFDEEEEDEGFGSDTDA